MEDQKLQQELARARFENEILLQQLDQLNGELARFKDQATAREQLIGEIRAGLPDLGSELREALGVALRDSIPAPREVASAIDQFAKAKGHGRQESQILAEARNEIRRIENELVTERKKFRDVAQALYTEVEYLRQVYPIRGLLAAKDAELVRVKKALRHVPPNHPDRASIERIVSDHQAERNQIERVAKEMEERLNEQSRSMQEMAQESPIQTSRGSQPPPFNPTPST